jgi:hypothetical protein
MSEQASRTMQTMGFMTTASERSKCPPHPGEGGADRGRESTGRGTESGRGEPRPGRDPEAKPQMSLLPAWRGLWLP